jgi:ubiquinone/menaquinone biosynthesis C-methylase UbiE
MPEVTVVFDAADQYEQVMGEWSRGAGKMFLDWLSPRPGLRWLDVGCGTGAFSEVIMATASPQRLMGVDPASAQIASAEKKIPTAEWRVADAMNLPLEDDMYDLAVSALVLNFIPDPGKAVEEMRRVLCKDGIVAGYLWERSATEDWSPHSPMERGLQKVGAEVLRPPMKPASSPEGAKELLQSANLSEISVKTIEVKRTFPSFEEYWRVQNLPLTPASKSIAALSTGRQEMLREVLRDILPISPDGSITYPARAVAFQARKPN